MGYRATRFPDRRAMLQREWRDAGIGGAQCMYQLGMQLDAQEAENRQSFRYVSDLTPLGEIAVQRYQNGKRGGEFPRGAS